MTSLVVLAWAALAVACTGSAQSPLADSDDPELRRIAAELLPDLAVRSGLELRAPVRIARRSREELTGYLAAKLDQELPPDEAAGISESYRLLGLVPEGLELRKLLLEVYTEQVAGFYDPDSTALFVMDDQPAEALRTVLIHELVHAVQDQATNLDSLTAPERGNDRQEAAQAAIEGQATLVMLEYVAEQRRGGPVDLSEIPDFAAQVRPALEAMRAQYPALAGAPRVIQEALLFPYLEGTGFVQRLWRQAGDRVPPFGDLLPQSTEQVLSEGPLLPPGRDEPTEIRLGVDERVRYSNTLGAMETGVLMAQLAEMSEGARGWDGDRFVLVDGADGPALAWLSVWDDGAARDAFVSGLMPHLGAFPKRATLEAREVDGRAAALLRVGSMGPVLPVLSEGAAR